MSDAYVVGAGMIPFGRYPDRTYFQLAAEATLMALDDCGLSIKDVGVVYASSTFNAASMLGQKMMQQIGQTGVPVINVSNACASGATAVREAFVAIKSGLYDVVLAVGAEKNPRGMLAGSPVDGPPPEGLFGSGRCPRSLPRRGWCTPMRTERRWSSSRKLR